MKERRSGISVTVSNDTHAIGGSRKKCVETYDHRVGEWQTLPSAIYLRSSAAARLHKGNVCMRLNMRTWKIL